MMPSLRVLEILNWLNNFKRLAIEKLKKMDHYDSELLLKYSWKMVDNKRFDLVVETAEGKSNRLKIDEIDESGVPVHHAKYE